MDKPNAVTWSGLRTNVFDDEMLPFLLSSRSRCNDQCLLMDYDIRIEEQPQMLPQASA